jgi:uncharacterized protein (DUF3084 family)
MNKTEIIEKIKSFFFDEEVKMDSSDWKSGESIIRVNGPVEVGTAVEAVTEAGLTTIENGEYPIDDTNVKLVITDNVITEVIEEVEDEVAQDDVEVEADADESTEADTEEVKAEEDEKEEDDEDDKKKNYAFSEEDFKNLKTDIGTIIKETFESLNNEMDSIKKENEELKARFEKFANEDGEESITKSKEKKIKFEDKYEKLKFFGKR